MNITGALKKIDHHIKLDYLGLSGYKMNFLRKGILQGMYRRYGGKGVYYFVKNFLQTRYAGSERVDSLYPFIRITYEPTTLCNLKCKMCARQNENNKTGSMSLKNFRRGIDSIPNLSYVHFTGLGEALMHPDILEMTGYLQSKNIKAGIVTNGTLLTRKVSEVLLEQEIDWIGVSVDSLDRERYKEIRGLDKLGEVIENIRNLQSNRKRLRKKIYTEIVTVYMKENRDELTKFVEFTHSSGMDSLRVKIIEEWDWPGTLSGRINREEQQTEYLSRIYTAAKAAKKSGIHFEATREVDDLDYRRAFENSDYKCESPWYHFNVLYNGDVVPCLCVKNLQRSAVMGNLLVEDFDKIWNGDKFRSLRRKHLMHRLPEMCSHCTRTIAMV